jgi:hypothetical protein
MAWVRVTTITGTKDHKLLTYGTTVETDSFIFGVSETSGALYFEVNNVNCASSVGTSTASDGTWHHIAAVWDGTSVV